EKRARPDSTSDSGHLLARAMVCMPVPGRSDNVAQRGVLRRPAQDLARPIAGGDQLRWITRSPRRFLSGHRLAADGFDHPDYLPHRMPLAGAEIESQPFVAGRETQ